MTSRAGGEVRSCSDFLLSLRSGLVESRGMTLLEVVLAVLMLSLVGVTVYDADAVGDYELKGEPIAFLSRIIDPFAPRNPDSLENFNSPDRIVDWLRPLLGGGAAGASGSGSNRLDGRRLK